MWLKEFLWKYVIRRMVRKYGFVDPFSLLGQIRRFAPSSKVSEPIELLRAGVLFHARGLINRTAIQHNLDWIWPFWVEQQFNPHSESFLPRAFSITYVNLTHRNWTAVGIPGCAAFPIAQILLRAGDQRFFDIVRAVADLASPTGQWPEAIHPRTKGGCMGDGQHAWASAEWVMMMRSMFVQEGKRGLILAAGIAPAWLHGDQTLAFGPTPTAFGTMTVTIEPSPEVVQVAWAGDWRDRVPHIDILLPDALPVHIAPSEKRTAVRIERE
jgi:hypothetical protein